MWNDLRVALFLVYNALKRGNKFTLALTILVSTLAFINIIFISAIMNGAISKVYQQARDNYVSDIVITPPRDQQYITQARELARSVCRLPGVVSCCSRYSLSGVIRYDPDKDNLDVREKAWSIKSINPEEEMKVTSIQNYMVAGNYLDKDDRDKMIMGREISGGWAASYEQTSLRGARVGDEVTVTYENGVVRKYTIKGIFNTNFTMADLNVFISEKEMESVLQCRNRASEMLVKTDASLPENAYIDRLVSLGIDRQQINTFMDYIGALASMTQTFDIVKGIITFIGLLVAGVTIFIVIFIATINRKRQIGILKAIGMNERIIVTSYVLQAAFYSVLGVIVGMLILGFGIVPYFVRHPFPLPIGLVSLALVNRDLTVSILSMVAVSIVAGFIPSWMVTRQNIIKAIWG